MEAGGREASLVLLTSICRSNGLVSEIVVMWKESFNLSTHPYISMLLRMKKVGQRLLEHPVKYLATSCHEAQGRYRSAERHTAGKTSRFDRGFGHDSENIKSSRIRAPLSDSHPNGPTALTYVIDIVLPCTSAVFEKVCDLATSHVRLFKSSKIASFIGGCLIYRPAQQRQP